MRLRKQILKWFQKQQSQPSKTRNQDKIEVFNFKILSFIMINFKIDFKYHIIKMKMIEISKSSTSCQQSNSDQKHHVINIQFIIFISEFIIIQSCTMNGGVYGAGLYQTSAYGTNGYGTGGYGTGGYGTGGYGTGGLYGMNTYGNNSYGGYSQNNTNDLRNKSEQNDPRNNQINQRRIRMQEHSQMINGLQCILKIGMTGVAIAQVGCMSWDILKKIVLFLSNTSAQFLKFMLNLFPLRLLNQIFSVGASQNMPNNLVNKMMMIIRLFAFSFLLLTLKIQKQVKKQVIQQHQKLVEQVGDSESELDQIDNIQSLNSVFHQKEGYF